MEIPMNRARKKEVLDHRAHMQFVLQLSDIPDPRKPVLVQQNKVRRCLQTIRSLEREVYLTQRPMEAGEKEEEERLEEELEGRLEAAKEDLSVATMNLRSMIRAFKESRLLSQPGQFAGVPEPVQRIEIWLDDAHWWLTQKDGQLEIADISINNFSYNRVSFSDDSGEHRLELGSFLVHNLTPNTPAIYQQVLVPYDPKSRRLRVDRNICLRVYCRDKARVAGITVREHLEVNVVPLQVSLTAKFFQTMQDFFFPKTEGDGPDPLEPDHSHLFGVHPTQSFGGDTTDGNSMQRGSSYRRSTISTSASHASLQQAGYSPPASPTPREPQGRRGKHLSLSHLDTVEKMKERASHINTFIYVKIPQTTLCITYKGDWSYKDLQNQVMNMPTLEYHNRNLTWRDMLMEVKRDYKNAIIHQTLKSAIGMKESEESSGLASPKLRRDSDLLFQSNKNSKAGKGKKLFGKLSSMKEDSDSDKEMSPGGSASPVPFPPLRDQETNLKKTLQRLTKLSQEVKK
ncbi:Protein KIAA0100 [Geodia barretti]|uniref:Protein KIAA0100 n=1 Tax=Geodia barretti TaxID=519541 RepID=A0AA35U1D9_GEOBA|nr:Protein KIAA0100 [Geodia barretti]